MAFHLDPSRNPEYCHGFMASLSVVPTTLKEMTLSAFVAVSYLAPTETNSRLRGRVQKGKCLSTADVIYYMQRFETVQTIDHLLRFPKVGVKVVSKIELDESHKIIFIPYLIKNRIFWDHIVFFAVNQEMCEIIFYDSKGWSLKDHQLEAIYEAIQGQFQDYTFFQNLKAEQSDYSNCGVYVLNRIELLSKNLEKSFQTILEENPFGYKDAMSWRCEQPAEEEMPKVRVRVLPSDGDIKEEQ